MQNTEMVDIRLKIKEEWLPAKDLRESSLRYERAFAALRE